ncbi:CHAT domain-containing protein [Kordia sp.]|uniref:CHAT domain-containing protein n=1 Tax=Kordia sp. TaxID=1965332 RepID=UPI003D27D96B
MGILNAQELEVTNYYNERLEQVDLKLHEREALLDSLLHIENVNIDQIGLANIYYELAKTVSQIDYKKAIFYSEKAQEIALKINNLQEEVFVKNHNNKVLFYYRDNQFNKALKEAEKYLDTYTNTDVRLGKLYRLIGKIYIDLGDFQQSIDNYDKSIFILKSFDDYKELSRTYISKLRLLISFFDDSYSKDILEIKKELESLQEKFVMKYKNRAAINLNLAVYYDYTNQYEKAIGEYENVYNLSLKNEDTIGMAKSFINLGSIYEENNQLEKSKQYLNQAKEFTQDDFFLNSSISNNLADIYQKENNHQKALIHYQKAITQALQISDIAYQKLPAFQDIEFSSNKIDVLGYLIDKANGWIAYYDAEQNPEHLENALKTFTLADKLIDIIYVESREDLSKLFWRKKGATFYPKAVEVCFRLQQPEKAFFFMEKNKAILLLENMTNANAKRLSKLPENILEREQYLIKEIKTLESEIQEYTSKKGTFVDSLKNNVFKYKKEYATFIDSLETEFPKYYNYKKNINIVTLEDVQKQLKKDELILQYIVGQEKGFVTLLSSSTIQLKELPNTNKLTKIVTTYKEAISKPFINKNDKNTYTETAKKLYKQLIPFDNSETRLAQKRITIIADGILQYIPFEALLNSKDEYLIKTAEIHYNYSLSSAAQSRQNNTKIPKNFIAIAPTKFKNDQFGALETSTAELKRLTNIFGANHFQYEKATKKRFTEAYGNYKIVHLSTHGGINNTIPWMAFYDEKMTLDELYFTKNQSELVVLSACKTSDGELKKGEGVMSLARGFFNAGAKSVVSSLWDINEKASNDIIQEFYKNLVNGDTKSEALQKAKLTYIQQNKNTSEASPYYWSGLTITGDVRPINMQHNNFIYYSFAGIFLILIGVFIRKRRQKKKAV